MKYKSEKEVNMILKKIKIYMISALILTMGISLSACSDGSQNLDPSSTPPSQEENQVSSSEMDQNTVLAEYHKITPEKAKEMLDSDEPTILLDVRSTAEYEEIHIDGAVVIPDNELAQLASAQLNDQSATILVYCRSGRRSALAAKTLVELGYTEVYDFGGIQDWPYETVSGQ